MMAASHIPGTPQFDIGTMENLRTAIKHHRLYLPQDAKITLMIGQQRLPLTGQKTLIDSRLAQRVRRCFRPGKHPQPEHCHIDLIEDPFPAILINQDRHSHRSVRALFTDALLADLCEVVLPMLQDMDPLLSFEASSPSLTPMVSHLRRIAVTSISVMITGETGTGKEVLGRALHRRSGRVGNFIAENCAALPEGLMEAELFGYSSGAFTGASKSNPGRIRQAHKGTLFLDEIGDLPLFLQAKLLRVLEERKVRALGALEARSCDARTLSATHRDLQRLIQEGRFRADLYYRLAGSVVCLPPLRERPEDIPFLASALLRRISREGIGPGARLAPKTCEELTKCEFPGNVRELFNVLREAAALSPGRVIPDEIIPYALPAPSSTGNLEVDAISQALALAGGVKTSAARHLGWSRQKLYRRIEALGLDV